MFEVNRREVVGKALIDFAKILFGGHIASGFFAALHPPVRLVLALSVVVFFVAGWWVSPPKKGVL